MRKKIYILSVFIVFLFLIAFFNNLKEFTHSADAANNKGMSQSPVKALKVRDVYYPGTEDLAPNVRYLFKSFYQFRNDSVISEKYDSG